MVDKKKNNTWKKGKIRRKNCLECSDFLIERWEEMLDEPKKCYGWPPPLPKKKERELTK